MTTNAENNREQGQPGSSAADLQYLRSVFGSALVPLRGDLGRLGIALGLEALPLGPNVIAQNEAVSESEPAGVVCGGGSGLLVLAFPSRATAHEFLSNNPALAGVLVTRLQEALVVWLRPDNRLPPNTIQDNVKIITCGVIPIFHPDSQMYCTIYRRGNPIAVDLGTLVFSGFMKHFVVDWVIREKHGPPTIQVSPRRRQLNPMYWSHWISAAMRLKFDNDKGVFVAVVAESEAEVIIPAAKLHGVIADMLRHARQAGADLPIHEINPRRITEIETALKMFCSVSTPVEAEVLSEFVTTKLERHPGSILSKNAVMAALLEFRSSRGLQTPGNENVLRRDLRSAILKLFGVRERHDAGRWFKGLALRSTNGEQAAQQPLPKAGGASGDTAEPQQPGATMAPN